jgi:hypothetical protein
VKGPVLSAALLESLWHDHAPQAAAVREAQEACVSYFVRRIMAIGEPAARYELREVLYEETPHNPLLVSPLDLFDRACKRASEWRSAITSGKA